VRNWFQSLLFPKCNAHRYVTEIDLSDNNMGKGIAGLPPLLKLNFSVVTTLHLRGNKLGDREVGGCTSCESSQLTHTLKAPDPMK
jgi:hypothetical protein